MTPQTPKGTWARVVLDSLHPENGVRLTTLEVNYPYIVHPEMMTHCAFSRNSISYRAIKTSRMIADLRADPFIPARFPRTANPDMGMNPDGYFDLDSPQHIEARAAWQKGMEDAIDLCEWLSSIGVHKQVASRPLGPYRHNRLLITATEWDNFFNLRLDSNAMDQIQLAAVAMREAIGSSVPVPRRTHLPFVQGVEDPTEYSQRYPFDEFLVSAGRCARISYAQHNGKVDASKDEDRGSRLQKSGHMSPFEHQGIAIPEMGADTWSGKFRGWQQYRKLLPNEAIWIPPS